MPGNTEANRGDVLLMVGTRKGVFFLTADAARKSWSLSGPHHAGSDVFHLAYDYREAGTIFAAINSPIWGSEVQRSEDLGATWRKSRVNPAFPKERNDSVEQVWHIEPGSPASPESSMRGSPAALFKSPDGGETWSEVVPLSEHPTRAMWEGGFGGLCLHSMVLDPADDGRMWVGISAVGVFGTEDGGASWSTMNAGVRADFMPDPFLSSASARTRCWRTPRGPAACTSRTTAASTAATTAGAGGWT